MNNNIYEQILFGSNNDNLAALDSKINAVLYYKPPLILKIYRNILLIINTFLATAGIAGGAYIGYKLGNDDFRGALVGAGTGFIAVLKPILIATMKYKIINHIVKQASLNIINNNKLPKEEKIKIINGLIDETKQTISKLTNDDDIKQCQKALNRLQIALSQIQQQN